MEILVIVAVIYLLVNLFVKGFMKDYTALDDSEPEQTDGGMLYVAAPGSTEEDTAEPSPNENEIPPAFTILPGVYTNMEEPPVQQPKPAAFYDASPPAEPAEDIEPDRRDFTDTYASIQTLFQRLEAQRPAEPPPAAVHRINLRKTPEPVSLTLEPGEPIALEPPPPGMDYGSPPRQNLVPNPYNEIPFDDFHVS
ncbi:hypothetical protein [Anaeromassilibacillus senegalensis]|uniref:hypothetical protein n=1 Tax=Anaeromassilibacillus senegalensis TaxID=1673717 RepID=UPI0006812DD4|nr:hypothetical protein [Anaeromassilibacillus senegalensis]